MKSHILLWLCNLVFEEQRPCSCDPSMHTRRHWAACKCSLEFCTRNVSAVGVCLIWFITLVTMFSDIQHNYTYNHRSGYSKVTV